ncbi:MAG: hypothetical protein ACRCZI_12295 [Cetobacterium sp.]
MPLELFSQAAGSMGVAQTLRKMASLAQGAKLDALIRDQAEVATGGCFKGARDCQCYSLLSWVSRTVRYIADPAGAELLHDPRLMARGIHARKRVYGDCDDMSMYLAALALSIGLQPTFRAVGYNGRPFQHVYVMCCGLKLDATRSAWDRYSGVQTETSVMEQRV